MLSSVSFLRYVYIVLGPDKDACESERQIWLITSCQLHTFQIPLTLHTPTYWQAGEGGGYPGQSEADGGPLPGQTEADSSDP